MPNNIGKLIPIEC